MSKSIFIGSLLCFAFVLLQFRQGNAQSCDCPTVCGTCVGGVIQYTLQYKGDETATVTVKDQTNVVFEEVLHPGDQFTVSGMLQDGRFAGIKIYVYVDGKENTAIDVLCTSNTVANSVFGDFVIVEARRLDGKKICCVGLRRDQIAPVYITAPSDIILFTEVDKCGATAHWDEPTVDDCNLFSVTSDSTSGSVFPKGSTLVTYEARDDADNVTLHSFTVTVTDNVLPVISNCSPNIDKITTEEEGSIVTWDEISATDNCSLLPASITHSSGEFFPVGDTEVVYSASDEAGNVATCTFTVKVTLKPVEPPPPPPGEEPPALQISRIVTPDGDGKNDFWIIGNIEKFPENTITVLDRWGGTIYSASHYDNENVVWNGASGSRTVPAGTYFYIVTYSRQGIPVEEKGFIELIP
jgi:gliding motility-associated-like protein